jgi:hypothetical protein
VRAPKLTYANVTASLALFIALGGTSYAVTRLPRNSVGNRQLKSNAVTSGKIRDGAVGSNDLSASARSASRGPRGPEGPAGANGATGPSETIQVKRPDVLNIGAGANGAATVATMTLDPGSWVLDGNTAVIYTGAGSDFFECRLQTAAGDVLAKGVLRVGSDAGSTLGGPVPVRVAATFTVPTQVTYVCQHYGTLPGQPYADRTTLQASRTGRLEDR